MAPVNNLNLVSAYLWLISGAKHDLTRKKVQEHPKKSMRVSEKGTKASKKVREHPKKVREHPKKVREHPIKVAMTHSTWKMGRL